MSLKLFAFKFTHTHTINRKCGEHRTCECRAAWTGDRCQTLAIKPTSKDSGYNVEDEGHHTSSWGGAVLRGEDDKYHMYAFFSLFLHSHQLITHTHTHLHTYIHTQVRIRNDRALWYWRVGPKLESRSCNVLPTKRAVRST